MLFGWNRVGAGLHFFATVMVALGTLISATWILASNSWMQTPAGYAIVDGRVIPTDWLAVIFNPSFPIAWRICASPRSWPPRCWSAPRPRGICCARNDQPAIRKMLSMSLWMLLLVAPLQLLIGDLHGLNTLAYQPAKIAAIEGHWEKQRRQWRVPLILFGLPDMAPKKTRLPSPSRTWAA